MNEYKYKYMDKMHGYRYTISLYFILFGSASQWTNGPHRGPVCLMKIEKVLAVYIALSIFFKAF